MLYNFFYKSLPIWFIISFSTFTVAGEEVSIIVNHWPPWTVAHDEKREVVTDGLVVELLKETFSRLGYKIKLEQAPWKRALHIIEKGEADIIPLLMKTPDRERYILFTVPVYIDPLLLVYSADRFENFEWEKWEDLKPYTIGTVRGYTYGKTWDQAVKTYGLNIEETTTEMMNMKKVLGGRFELALTFHSVTKELFNNIPESNKLRISKKVIDRSVFYYGISKKSFLAEKIDKINMTIEQMKDDGTYKKILKEYYFGADTK